MDASHKKHQPHIKVVEDAEEEVCYSNLTLIIPCVSHMELKLLLIAAQAYNGTGPQLLTHPSASLPSPTWEEPGPRRCNGRLARDP